MMGRIGTPKPFVSMVVPVVINGEYGGCISGILNLEKVREDLEITSVSGTLFTLLDKSGNVIMTSRKDQKVMTLFSRSKGMFIHVDNLISQWMPVLPPNIPASERWKKSFYVAEATIGSFAEWKLILEQPVEPFQKALYDNYTGKLIILFVILISALALAEFLSRNIVITLELLRKVTHELPVKLLQNATIIEYPHSSIVEVQDLITNFKEMADTLSGQGKKIELKIAQLSLAQQMANLGYWNFDIASQKHVWSDMMFVLLNCDPAEEIPNHNKRLYLFHPDDRHLYESSIRGCLAGNPYNIVLRIILPDSSFRYIKALGYPQFDTKGKVTSLFGVTQDITERKIAEEVLQNSHNKLEHLVEERTVELLIAKECAESASRAKSEFLAQYEPRNTHPHERFIGHDPTSGAN